MVGQPRVTRAEPPAPGAAEVPGNQFDVLLGPKTGLVVQTGSSKVALHGYAWGRAESVTQVGDETNLDASIPVARVFMVGDFLEQKLGLFAQTEFGGGNTELLDLFGEWRSSKALVIRVGQFRTPYSRAYITPLTNLELPTRGLVVNEFNLGRDTGAMASGTVRDGFFHYDLAVVNGAKINDLSGNRDSPSVIGRTEFRFGSPVPYDQAPSLELTDPTGVTIGLGGAFSRRAITDANGTSTEQLGNASVDFAAMKGPLSLNGEGFWRSAQGSPRPANAFGAYAQAGVFVIPRQLELGGRAGWLSDGPDVQSYEAFVAGYMKNGNETLGHHLKVILAYRYDSADANGGSRQDRHSEVLQVQLFF